MTDAELQELVTQQLAEYPNVDAGWIDVSVDDGTVTLAGTVGTDGEKRVAEKVVVEVIGVENCVNELIVNELHREELPEDADEAEAVMRETDEELGRGLRQQSDTAAHLVDDLEAETRGTHDPQQAIQEGPPYVPPDRPVPQGYDSEENH
jgi:hypothetical protein